MSTAAAERVPDTRFMIDLSNTKAILRECVEIISELHGQELDETDALSNQGRSQAKRRRAEMSQMLQLLATRLELAAATARIEYWYARGESDPLNPNRG